MSKNYLGKKQTSVSHNCISNDKKNDLVITPHRQTIGYIRLKRHTLRKKIISKEKQIIRKRFSKRTNAISESETSAIRELHILKDSINKNCQIEDQI